MTGFISALSTTVIHSSKKTYIRVLGHGYFQLKRVLGNLYGLLGHKPDMGKPLVEDASLTIYQCYYDEHTKKHLDAQFIPYYNPTCTKYFADGVIMDLFKAGALDQCSYFGIVSWRIKYKLPKWQDIKKFMREDGLGHDFYYVPQNIFRPHDLQPLWKQANKQHHTDFTSQTQLMLRELGYDVDLLQMQVPASYFSYHICKKELYEEYLEKFLIPLVNIMEDKSRVALQQWLNEDAGYVRHGHPVARETLRNITGFPYYTKHPFITERLFPTYAALRNWRGKAIT